MNRHVTDFECTINEPVAVWLWYDYNIDTGVYTTGRDIESFIVFLEAHPKHDFFFHNLAYDGSFIFDYLINVRHVKHNVTDYPLFQPTLQGSMKDFTYCYDFDKWVNVIDTMSILTGSLASFAHSVGLAKGDTRKDAMYTNEQIPELSLEQWTRAEAYCKLDVEILARVCEAYHLFDLMQIKRTKAALAYAGLTEKRLATKRYVFRPNYTPRKPIEHSPLARTQAMECVVYVSKRNQTKEKTTTLDEFNAWSSRKRSCYIVLRHETRDIDTDWKRYDERIYKTESIEYESPYVFYENPGTPYRVKYAKRYGEELCASTEHVDLKRLAIFNKAIADSYKGGVNYVNPLHQNQWLNKHVYVYDINSMYPWLYSTMAMPDIRTLKRVDMLDKHDLGFVMIRSIQACVKRGRFPLIKLKTGRKHPNSSHYREKLDINDVFVLTNLEYQYLLENYSIKKIEGVQYLRADENKQLHEAFKLFCECWYAEKKEARANGDITREWFAKLMLNSLYGKFGQFESQYESYQLVGVDDELTKTDVVAYVDSMWDADLAVASYITAYGRVKLANDINRIGLERFCYCDTDSLHVLGEAPTLDVGLELGQWKLEGVSTRSKFIQPKTYGELLDGEWHSVCAGFTDTIPMSEFEAGLRVKVKRRERVKGGSIIRDKWLILGSNIARDYTHGYTLEQLDRLIDENV